MGEKKAGVTILAPAQQELEDIAQYYIGTAGKKAAKKITDGILRTLGLLETNPFLGFAAIERFPALVGYRIVVSGGRYVCAYRVIGNTVFVYHIADCRTDYPKSFGNIH